MAVIKWRGDEYKPNRLWKSKDFHFSLAGFSLSFELMTGVLSRVPTRLPLPILLLPPELASTLLQEAAKVE